MPEFKIAKEFTASKLTPLLLELEEAGGRPKFGFDTRGNAWITVKEAPVRSQMRADGKSGISWFPEGSKLPCKSLPEMRSVSGDVLEVPLGAVEWVDAQRDFKVHVSSRLKRAGSQESPSLWVWLTNPLAELKRLADDGDDQLLAKFDACVLQDDAGRVRVVLRALTPDSAPPMALQEAQACVRYQKHNHLYLAEGSTLKYPIRRDVAVRLYCTPERMAILLPGEPEMEVMQVPLAGFKKLPEMIEYGWADQDVVMDAWEEQHLEDLFRFEPYEEKLAPVVKPVEPEPEPEPEPVRTEVVRPAAKAKVEKRAEKKAEKKVTPAAAITVVEPREIEKRIIELSSRLTGLSGPRDEQLSEICRELSAAYAATERRRDAAVAAAVCMWYDDDLPAAQLWQAAAGGDLEAAVRNPGGPHSDLKIAAAFGSSTRDEELRARLVTIDPGVLKAAATFAERSVDVRSSWLMWMGLATLTSDTLTVAQARDKHLARLAVRMQTSDVLAPIREGSGSSYAAEGANILTRMKASWLSRGMEQPSSKSLTSLVADWMFALLAGRIGRLSEAVMPVAGWEKYQSTFRAGPMEQWLWAAMTFRLEDAKLRRVSNWSPELLEAWGSLTVDPSYQLTQLRSNSRLLDPLHKPDPYLPYNAQREGRRDMQAAPTAELGEQVLLQKNASAAISLAVSLGADYAVRALSLSDEVLEVELKKKQYDTLLHRLSSMVMLAGQFGLADRLSELLKTIEKVLLGNRSIDSTALWVESLLDGALTAARRMGFGGEGMALCQSLLAAAGGSVEAAAKSPEALFRLRMRTQLAGALASLGDVATATPMIEEAEKLLLNWPAKDTNNLGVAKQIALTTQSIGQLDINTSSRLMALFDAAPAVTDTRTYARHFSVCKLWSVEAVVRALGGETGESPKLRSWMDDDEWIIRQRIHANSARALSGV